MTDTIYELQVGYHVDKTIPYQRIICDTDFHNAFYEINNKGEVAYSKTQPQHWIPEVQKACADIDTVLKVAMINHKEGEMIATIRDGEIITGDDIDIWNDIKVWNNGTYNKKQPLKLPYTKHSYHNKYLRSGINEIKMHTEKLYHKGHVLQFDIETSTWQSHYTVNIMGTNRLERELTNNIHGDYHGYRYFNSFEEVQKWFKDTYNVTLVKQGETIYYNY